ncbi:MAG TPA: GNAT family N-acetyltransferase [Caulobacteraceae bacterium]|jgi:phosphinothricin acetyltransferase|nr:GNAT family N-acetyltransferase [Caulobacteraceae bacterium]
MRIRPAQASDAAALAAVYGHHVTHGLGTFEEVPPTPEDMAGRLKAVTDWGLPYLVAEIDGQVAGLAYAGVFRPRAAYRYTVEDSVYIAPDRVGQGVGKALLGEVIRACEAMGLRQMVAMIGDIGNFASIGLHGALGFTHVGILPAAGYKHGRWLDVVQMSRPLNAGASAPPDAPGLALGGH